MGSIKIKSIGAKGFTMMEIMVVVFILAAFLGLAATRFRVGSEKDLNNAVRELALLGRHLRAQARIHNQTYRIVFEFPDSRNTDSDPVYKYSVEYSSQRVYLPGPEDDTPLGAEPADTEAQSSFMPAEKYGDKGSNTLMDGLRITQVELESYPNPIVQDQAMIHFFPNGRVEESVVQLEWGSDEPGGTLRKWSVYFRPFTGDPEIISDHLSLGDLGAKP